MDSITNLIKSEIKRQYKSLRQFSEKSGIPYSTLSNALAKGVGGTSYDTVNKIMEHLKLKPVHGGDVEVFNPELYEIYKMLSLLDDRAVQAVKTILHMEYDRCMNSIQPSSMIHNRSSMAMINPEVGGAVEELKITND